MSTLLVKKLRDRFYQFTDRNGEEEVDAYFVIGSKKAVMIDGLENACGLYEKAREITDLPGHTPGSCVLYCKEENIMFSSDSLGSGDIWMSFILLSRHIRI